MQYIETMIHDIREYLKAYLTLPKEYRNRVIYVPVSMTALMAQKNMMEHMMLSLPKDAKLVYVSPHAPTGRLDYCFASTEFPLTPEGSKIPEAEVMMSTEQGPYSTDQHRSWRIIK